LSVEEVQHDPTAGLAAVPKEDFTGASSNGRTAVASVHVPKGGWVKKGKGKVPHWGTSTPQPQGLLCSHPKEFLHSSLEALHTERYTAPQLAKEGTM
jgi:hypothetical protein